MLFILTNILMFIQLPVLLFVLYFGGGGTVSIYTGHIFYLPTADFAVLDLICKECEQTSRLLHTALSSTFT